MGADVSSRRVCLTHVSRGSLSGRSEMPSRGDWLGCGGTTSLADFRSSTLGFAVLATCHSVVTGAGLGPAVGFGADLLVLAVFLVVIVSACLRASTNCSAVGFGVIVGVVLTMRLPRTTCCYPAPRLSCLVEGLAFTTFSATGWPVSLLLFAHSGAGLTFQEKKC